MLTTDTQNHAPLMSTALQTALACSVDADVLNNAEVWAALAHLRTLAFAGSGG